METITKIKEYLMIFGAIYMGIIVFIAWIEDPLSVPVRKGIWQTIRKNLRRDWRYWGGKQNQIKS